MECLLPYLHIVTVPHIMVGLKRMLDYRGVGLGRFHCIVLIMICLSQCIIQYFTLYSVYILLLHSVFVSCYYNNSSISH